MGFGLGVANASALLVSCDIFDERLESIGEFRDKVSEFVQDFAGAGARRPSNTPEKIRHIFVSRLFSYLSYAVPYSPVTRDYVKRIVLLPVGTKSPAVSGVGKIRK